MTENYCLRAGRRWVGMAQRWSKGEHH